MSEEVVERSGEKSSWKQMSDSDSAEFEHSIVENGAGVRECTIYPQECADDDIVTNWVTAASGSFVALEAVR